MVQVYVARKANEPRTAQATVALPGVFTGPADRLILVWILGV